MNTIVKLKLAKLLKEKDFKEPCRFLRVGGKYRVNSENEGDLFDNGIKSLQIPNCWFLAPTIIEVVMWLYEKHGIWTGVELTDNTKEFYFQPTIWASKDREYHDDNMIDQAKRICNWKEWKFNSPTEAYETAIDYCLTNLI